MTRDDRQLEGDRDQEFLPLLRDISYRPVFIMAAHRSGTTVLNSLLAHAQCFNIVNTYHVLKHDQLLYNHEHQLTAEVKHQLNETFAERGLATRLIDNVKLSADMPEEYVAVLHAKTRQTKICEKSFPAFDQFCRKVQYISDPSRQLLLCNPFDFSNFIVIKQLLPNARFIFLHRNPIHILNSQLKAMRRNWTEGNAYNEMLSDTFARLQKKPLFVSLMRWATNPESRTYLAMRLLARRLAKELDFYFENIRRLDVEDYVVVRYEDLCEDPNRWILEILTAVDATTSSTDFEQWINPRALDLLPGVQRAHDRLKKKFRFATQQLDEDNRERS